LTILAAALGAATSGCISARLVKHKAMAHETFDMKTGEDKLVEGWLANARRVPRQIHRQTDSLQSSEWWMIRCFRRMESDGQFRVVFD
jgi:hypothetical protein